MEEFLCARSKPERALARVFVPEGTEESCLLIQPPVEFLRAKSMHTRTPWRQISLLSLALGSASFAGGFHR